MYDEIKRILEIKQLPQKLARNSMENGLKAIDAMLLGDKMLSDDGIINIAFLMRVKSEVENILLNGHSVVKTGVFIPVGLFGLSEGFLTPDLDIKVLGIGNHRFFLFHSALGLAILRFLYVKWKETDKQPRDDKIKIIQKLSGALLGGYAVGVGIHLAVDVFQPKSVQFPFFGSLINGTLVDDDIWLLGNSLWAFRIGADVFAITFADEINNAKAFVKEHFGVLTNFRWGNIWGDEL